MPTDPTTPVDIYDLDPFSLDSDGFKVSAGEREGVLGLALLAVALWGCVCGCSAVTADRSLSLSRFSTHTGTLIWHNRHKVACRVRCIGEYYLDSKRVDGSMATRGHFCGSPRFGFKWEVIKVAGSRFGMIDPKKYRVHEPHFHDKRGRPHRVEGKDAVLLGGGAAASTAWNCDSMVSQAALTAHITPFRFAYPPFPSSSLRSICEWWRL